MPVIVIQTVRLVKWSFQRFSRGHLKAAATVAMLGTISEGTGETLLPEMSLSLSQWIVLGALPLIAATIGTATARLTVMRAIGRMT